MSGTDCVTAGTLALFAAAASTTLADPAVDGLLGTDYGSPVAVQKVQTQFGDGNLNPPFQTWSNGSELDAAYARVSGGNLYLFLAGNLETNYNKLDLFFDIGAPGQNQLRRDNANVNFNALGRMGENLDGTNTAGNTDTDQSAQNQIGGGLKFDATFRSNFYMTVNCGWNNDDQDFRLYSDFASTPADPTNPLTPSTGFFVGGSTSANNRLIDGANGIKVGIDNSNTAGVHGGTLPVGPDEHPEAVTTGVELQIPLSVLGNPTGLIKVTAFVNGGGHNFLSNQVLGAVEPDPVNGFGNLAEPRTVDFSALSGNQYFLVYLTLPGDANSNGKIDADDFALLDRGFARYNGGAIAANGAGWTDGDFNGDGVVDAADFLLIDTTFAQHGGTFSPALLAARRSEFGDAYVAGLVGAVPEPSSFLAACGLAVLPLTRRRRV